MNNIAYYPVYNEYNSSFNPSTVHVRNTGLARFFKRYLLQEAISVFSWTIPETWDRAYFLYVLYIWGYICILKTDKYGIIPQHCGLGGFNVFYAPNKAIVSNPLFTTSYELEIGTDCELLKLEPDYLGLYDIIDYYGDLMALAAEACGVNLVNSKIAYAFGAGSKASAESLKALYDDIASGEPAVFFDKDLLNEDGDLNVELFLGNVKNNFIASELLDVMRSIRCMFLTDIGIPNSNLFKASGVGAEEVSANNIETRSKCALWLDELKKGCEKVRKKYNIELSVDWRKDIKEIMEWGRADEKSMVINRRAF